MPILRPVDKGFTRKLLLEFATMLVFYGVSNVNAHEMVFQFNPIWLPGMRKSVSTNGENADLKNCTQRF